MVDYNSRVCLDIGQLEIYIHWAYIYFKIFIIAMANFQYKTYIYIKL